MTIIQSKTIGGSDIVFVNTQVAALKVARKGVREQKPKIYTEVTLKCGRQFTIMMDFSKACQEVLGYYYIDEQQTA